MHIYANTEREESTVFERLGGGGGRGCRPELSSQKWEDEYIQPPSVLHKLLTSVWVTDSLASVRFTVSVWPWWHVGKKIFFKRCSGINRTWETNYLMVPDCQSPSSFSQSERCNKYSARRTRTVAAMFFPHKLKHSLWVKDFAIPNKTFILSNVAHSLMTSWYQLQSHEANDSYLNAGIRLEMIVHSARSTRCLMVVR